MYRGHCLVINVTRPVEYLRVVERCVHCGEPGRRNNFAISLGAFAHIQLEVSHFCVCMRQSEEMPYGLGIQTIERHYRIPHFAHEWTFGGREDKVRHV